MRTTFAVGRLTSKSAEIVLLEEEGRPEFPGPWTLRALVRERTRRSGRDASRDDADRGSGTVH